MIPFAAEIQITSRRRRHFHFWVPLPVIWVLLLPLVILLIPLFAIGCLFVNVDPFRALATFWRILCSLADTELAMEYTDRSFSMRLF